MLKRFKLRIFSQSLPFLCRFNTSSIFPPTPLTPPSKPKGRTSSPSTLDVGCGCRSIPTINHTKPSLPKKANSTSPPWTTIYNSSISFDAAAASPGKQTKKKTKPKEPTTPFSTTSTAETQWFSSEEEGAVSTDSSFSDFATQFGPVVVTKKKKVKKVTLGWEVKHHGLKKKLTCPTTEEPETESEMTDESFAVVKKTKDAYGDFKRSMMEMILENQMFDSGDLEQLLSCFLSLNPKQHYGVIIQAFSDIWEILFCKSPKKN